MKKFRSNWAKSRHDQEVIYRDFIDGQFQFFTYSDGQRIRVARSWAEDEVGRGRARYVDCER